MRVVELCSLRRNGAAEAETPQGMQYFDLEKVRYVRGFARTRDPLADNFDLRSDVQQNGDPSRRVDDDQRPLTEVAWIVRVAHSMDGYVRRPVQLDRRIVPEPLHQLGGGRPCHALYLGEQII